MKEGLSPSLSPRPIEGPRLIRECLQQGNEKALRQLGVEPTDPEVNSA